MAENTQCPSKTNFCHCVAHCWLPSCTCPIDATTLCMCFTVLFILKLPKKSSVTDNPPGLSISQTSTFQDFLLSFLGRRSTKWNFCRRDAHSFRDISTQRMKLYSFQHKAHRYIFIFVIADISTSLASNGAIGFGKNGYMITPQPHKIVSICPYFIYLQAFL